MAAHKLSFPGATGEVLSTHHHPACPNPTSATVSLQHPGWGRGVLPQSWPPSWPRTANDPAPVKSKVRGRQCAEVRTEDVTVTVPFSWIPFPCPVSPGTSVYLPKPRPLAHPRPHPLPRSSWGAECCRGAHLAGTGRGGPSGPQALFPPLPRCSLALEAQPQALGLHAHLASGVLPGTRAVSEGQGHRAAVPARGTAHRTSAGVTAGRSSFTEVASGPSASNRAAGPGPGGPGGGHRYGSIHPGACPLKLKSMGSSGAFSAALWPDPGHGARVGPGHHAEPAPAPP